MGSVLDAHRESLAASDNFEPTLRATSKPLQLSHEVFDFCVIRHGDRPGYGARALELHISKRNCGECAQGVPNYRPVKSLRRRAYDTLRALSKGHQGRIDGYAQSSDCAQAQISRYAGCEDAMAAFKAE